MLDKPLIIDDVIDKAYQSVVVENFIQHAPWYFVSDITFSRGSNHRKTPALSHLFIDLERGFTNYDYYEMVCPIAYEACKHINFKIHQITKARSFLQMPLSDTFKSTDVDALHVDLPYQHLVVLYYVYDSDGDTIIVDHKREGAVDFNLEAKDYPELARVTPKAGRCVVFDGDYYHTAEQPRDNLRAIINFDILGQFNV